MQNENIFKHVPYTPWLIKFNTNKQQQQKKKKKKKKTTTKKRGQKCKLSNLKERPFKVSKRGNVDCPICRPIFYAPLGLSLKSKDKQ